MIDIAIIGGGVAGCYCGYRLAHAFPDRDIRLYEMSERCGGRLWSVELNGVKGAPIEIGGMFFSSMQKNVHGLISKELKLPFSRVNWTRKHHFLRGKYLEDDAYQNSSSMPFNLEGAEVGQNPPALLGYVLAKMVPGFRDLWPFNNDPPASPQATYDRLRSLYHEARPLYDCGFWNVLSDIVSNEAYELLTSTIGSVGIFRNSNAFDVLWNLIQELGPQEHYKLNDGYQDLPRTMWERCSKKIGCYLNHGLTSVRWEGGAFALAFETPDGIVEESARTLILAMPQRALQLIELDPSIFKDVDHFCWLRDETVKPVQACKLFLTFEESWWDKSKFGPSYLDVADVSAAYTDLPMQQCYYLGSPCAGQAVLMAAYADDVAASFWSGLLNPHYPPYRNPVANEPDRLKLACPAAMVETARRQITEMHFDTATPVPNGAIFFDWRSDPYGAAWHSWSTRVRSWRIRPEIRQPNPELSLFICGEAYAERHGWVDGAINSAEMVLSKLGVDPPHWVDAGYVFEREGEKLVANRLQEFLIALGESLDLQRDYARDPDGTMGAFGLNEEEQAAMKSGDPKRVSSAADDDQSVAFIIVKFGGQ